MKEIADFIRENKEFFDLLIQVLILVIPAILTWLARTYVKSAESQKRLAAIVRLSNAAIDYAEDLHKRGDLDEYLRKWNLSDEIIGHTSTGIQKLNLAGKWLEGELDRLGIKMTDEEAQSWIASEFQKRIGDIGRTRSIDWRTREAISLLRALEQSGLISLPTDIDRTTQLADQVANWAITQAKEDREDLLREEAFVRVRTGLTTKPQPHVEAPELSLETQLAELAKQSVTYVEQLKLDHKLTLPEVDIAVAWVLTEVTQQGLKVTTDQIASAVRAAFEQQSRSP